VLAVQHARPSHYHHNTETQNLKQELGAKKTQPDLGGCRPTSPREKTEEKTHHGEINPTENQLQIQTPQHHTNVHEQEDTRLSNSTTSLGILNGK
jgi:hypothetical protein